MTSAARGLRRVEEGEEPIADPEQLRAVRAMARRVLLYGLATTVAATAVVFAT